MNGRPESLSGAALDYLFGAHSSWDYLTGSFIYNMTPLLGVGGVALDYLTGSFIYNTTPLLGVGGKEKTTTRGTSSSSKRSVLSQTVRILT